MRILHVVHDSAGWSSPLSTLQCINVVGVHCVHSGRVDKCLARVGEFSVLLHGQGKNDADLRSLIVIISPLLPNPKLSATTCLEECESQIPTRKLPV